MNESNSDSNNASVSDPVPLKRSKVSAVRLELLELQGKKCSVCGYPLLPLDAVLDHDHTSGLVRGVIHRSCNRAIGCVENTATRWMHKTRNAQDVLDNIYQYIKRHSAGNPSLDVQLIYPDNKRKKP